MRERLTTIGLVPPSDFPTAAYERVHARVCTKERNKGAWQAYAGGWNAVAYRFIACAQSDERFTDSICRFGGSPDPDHRYVQEDSLFSFFVDAVATFESFCFSMYAIGAMVNLADFDLSRPRAIKPAKVEQQFRKHFASEPIGDVLAAVLADRSYQDIWELRNILAHRVSPSREFFVGGAMDSTAKWAKKIHLGVETTHSRRQWLAGKLFQLCDAAGEFVFRNML